MSYKTYENYKDSEIEWIGLLPSSWQILKSKFIFNRINIPSTTGSEELLSVSEYYGVKPKKETIGEDNFLSRAESLIGYKKCSKNDLVMNIMLAWKKGLGVTEYNGIVSPAYEIFNINTQIAYPRYMNYLLRTDLYASEFKRHSYGVIDSRLRLYPDNFKEIDCILPSIREQEHISKYLDKKTAKIDTTIAKNKELIQLLEEKRVALINQVVTKGLNPDVPMKDSGVEWIGEIPEHWSVDNLNHYVTVTKLAGFEFTEYMEYVDDGEIIALRGLNIKNNQLDLSNIVKITKEVSDKLPRSKLYKNDIILSYVGTIGEAAIIDKDDTYHLAPNIAKISKKSDKINIKYLLYYISSDSGQKEISLKTSKTSQEVISMAKIRKIKIVTPTIDEQNIIANYLEKEILKINKIISKVNNTINLLEEYKTSLIHHVVTGKIDVRGEQIE